MRDVPSRSVPEESPPRQPEPGRSLPDDWAGKVIGRLPVLGPGSAGVHVRTLQGLLRARGHDMAIDGVFGAVTRIGVEGEQADHGLPANGLAGPDTWAVLITGHPL
jgi:peptidoglycan hydrolase-like protein with peptidoglycan-binding domain